MIKSRLKNTDLSTVILWLAVALSLVIRYISRNYISGDFRDCLYPWILEFREKGGWYAIKEAIGNYNVVYQYLLITISYFENLNALHAIKIVSIIIAQKFPLSKNIRQFFPITHRENHLPANGLKSGFSRTGGMFYWTSFLPIGHGTCIDTPKK